MKLLSLFSGIGAFEKALTNIGIDYELVGFSEIDKWAIESYCAIHEVDKGLNLGNISEIQTNKLGDVDIITHGSPCQDFSEVGTRKGGNKGSGTRSSLMWETVRIIENIRPKYVIWENVKGVLYKNNIHNFQQYLDKMSSLGYMNQHAILNARGFGVPQNRERVFVISVRKDCFSGLEFPSHGEDTSLVSVLESSKELQYLNKETQSHLLRNKNKKDLQMYDVGASRGRFCQELQKNVQRLEVNKHGLSNTLTSVCKDNIVYDIGGLRYFTPLECWRLMGFDDEDYWSASAVGVPKGELYKQAGNSIVVPVLEEIFKKLLK